jgi:hypothetical protein
LCLTRLGTCPCSFFDAAIALSAATGFFNGAEASIKLETISDQSA